MASKTFTCSGELGDNTKWNNNALPVASDDVNIALGPAGEASCVIDSSENILTKYNRFTTEDGVVFSVKDGVS